MERDGVVTALAATVAVLAALLAPAGLARLARAEVPPSVRLADSLLPPDGPGARDWTPAGCATTCDVPTRVRLHDRLYERGEGAAQGLVREDPRTRTLTWRLRGGAGPGHAVLIGALRSSSASDLLVRLDLEPVLDVPSGSLTLLDLPPGTRTVTVVEGGRFAATEQLVVREYRLSRSAPR